MSNRDFLNNASHSEKVAALNNERRLRHGDQPPSSFFREATKSRTLDGNSNYEAQRDLTIAGEASVVQYPRLPAGNPWAGDPVGIEPPLGEALGPAPVMASPTK